MPRQLSIASKLKQITGRPDKDLASDRVIAFVRSLPERTQNCTVTTGLSEKQVEWIDSIFERHFAG